jgi:pimeloyl-ACP methyl ester carboxylesterase
LYDGLECYIEGSDSEQNFGESLTISTEIALPYILINTNHSVYYQIIAGNTALPCLVFLHEGLGCTAMWGEFPELLCRATGCTGLIYDRLGYGLSSPSHFPRTIHYLHHSAFQELPAVLTRLLQDRSYILVGHSDGGTIALMHGAERPSNLLGIITEAAHVYVDSQTIAGIENAEQAWKDGKLQGLRKYHGDHTGMVFRAWSETWLSEWFRNWNVEYLLPSIKSPLLVIQGKNDHYGSAAQARTISTKSSGPAQMEIVDNCDHVPHNEAQHEVVTLMSEFISKLPGQR